MRKRMPEGKTKRRCGSDIHAEKRNERGAKHKTHTICQNDKIDTVTAHTTAIRFYKSFP